MKEYIEKGIEGAMIGVEIIYILIFTPLVAWILYINPSYNINVSSPIVVTFFSLVWFINKVKAKQ